MPPLYKHQERFLAKNPDKAIVSWTAGLGKTRGACEWIKLRYPAEALVICTKATKQKWIEDLKKWQVKQVVEVLTKEEFRKEHKTIKRYKVIIADECQNFSSPLFVARSRSAMSEALYGYLQSVGQYNILLMSANVIRSTPWNLHTLAVYAGHWIDWRKYQAKYFELVRRPYLTGMAWQPVRGWQKMMQPLIEKYCDVAVMSECVDVPMQEYQTVNIDLSEETKKAMQKVESEEWEPMAVWVAQHRLMNGKEKLDYIKQLGEENKKMVIVCHYREQLEQYAKELSKQKQVFVLHGGVKDQHTPVREAQEAHECYILLQAAMGVGFDLDKFDLMVFASMSYKYTDKSQMEGRINRIHNLHRNRYIHLLAGEQDRAVYDTILRGEDFDPTKYLAKKAKKEGSRHNPGSSGVVQGKLW